MKIVIAGAGPAGLTAAYELSQRLTDAQIVVFEETDTIGGISQTIRYKGNRMDVGGHRFFSKNKKVMDWWMSFLPLQGQPSRDDLLLRRVPEELVAGGPDPETTDRTFLVRSRISRIFYLRTFFDYPISIKWQTFAGMGFWRTVKAGAGYIVAMLHKKPETSLENFYINRFGKPLYRMFFEDYTTKVWGVHPSQLGADWGAQRVKGLSIVAILKDILRKTFSSNASLDKVETSLIERFYYPKYGPGQLWETVAEEAEKRGVVVKMQSRVEAVNVAEGRIVSVTVKSGDEVYTEECDCFLSSMPVKDLVGALRGVDVPVAVQNVASALPYRDFQTVGILVDKLKIRNHTKLHTYKDRVPDTWMYIQERDVRLGRLQVFNNWSPYLVADYENTIWIGLEYFCNEGDELWTMSDSDFIGMAVRELEKIDILDATAVLDTCRVRVRKAYPAYFGSYYELDKVQTFLDTLPNLYCIGRNGQHRYNNMDHSMLTAMEATDCIVNGSTDRTKVWNVNTETEYHETSKRPCSQ